MKHEIIELIKDLRKKKGWTQLYMAEQLKITQSSYGKIERGDVDITLGKLFKILNAIGQESGDFFKMLNEGGGPAVFTYDDVLQYQIDGLKSEKERQEAEIKYLNSEVERKDKRILHLEKESEFFQSCLAKKE